MNLRRRLAAVAAAVALALAAVAAPALAHANLVRSDPPRGAVLAEAPAAVVLEYSEPLDPNLAAVRLLDAAGRVVAPGPGMIEAGRPRELRLALPALGQGTYSAVWQVRSAADAHVTNGTVAFSVGVATAPVSLLPPEGAPDPATALPAAVDVVLKWLAYLAAAPAAGSLLFGGLVWRPAFRRWPGRGPEADAWATRLMIRLATIGIAALAAVTVGVLIRQALEAAGAGQGRGLGVLLAGRLSAVLLARLAALGVLALVARRLPAAGGGPAGPWAAAGALGLLTLLSFSLISHADSLGAPALVLDWLHLAAMAAWFGGLVPLALLLWRGRRHPELRDLPAVLVPRFSLVAMAGVGVVALTGVYAALVHVRTLDALLATAYGRTLLVKVGLFMLLGLMGAINLLVLTPRLLAGPGVAWMRRTVHVELSLAVLLLLSVGLLAAGLPAVEALQSRRGLGLWETAGAGRVRFTLYVAPLLPGENQFGVDLIDRRPGVPPTPATVLLRLTAVGMDMGTTQVETTTADGRRYTAAGSYVAMGGPWQIEVIVRRSGFDDVRHTFAVTVAEAGAGP